MRNEYLKALGKIEFILTYACTGRCKHCSEGEHSLCAEMIDVKMATDALRRISREYDIMTVMTFGGEPLLHPDAVYAVMSAATEIGIPKRQVITNGYFSKSADTVREVAARLRECGVNDLLLSVDAFHQESIPLDPVRRFAQEVKSAGVPIRLSPAWLVSPDDDNTYNRATRELLASFEELDIPVGSGNVVFPEGNALRYLGKYFVDDPPENPYAEDPCYVKCISFEPNGDVLGSNAHREDIMKILESYTPDRS